MVLLGHKRYNAKREWGMPGGNVDRTDISPEYGAIREFMEEMGLRQKHFDKKYNRAQKIDLVRTFKNNVRSKQNAQFVQVVPTNNAGFSAFGLVFDTAKDFEDVMGLTALMRQKRITNPTIGTRYSLNLSDETQGFTYVPINLAPNPAVLNTINIFPRANNSRPYRAVKVSIPVQKPGGIYTVTQLKIRRGVNNRAMQKTRALL